MTSRFELDKAEDARAASEAASLERFSRWLAATHPEIRDCIATIREFREHMGGFVPDREGRRFRVHLTESTYQ